MRLTPPQTHHLHAWLQKENDNEHDENIEKESHWVSTKCKQLIYAALNWDDWLRMYCVEWVNTALLVTKSRLRIILRATLKYMKHFRVTKAYNNSDAFMFVFLVEIVEAAEKNQRYWNKLFSLKFI